MGISEATFYVWKKKYGGLRLTELRELRQLRDENSQLKRLVADLTLDRHVLQEMSKKRSSAAQTPGHRPVDTGLFELSVRRSCRLLQLRNATWYYRSQARDSSAICVSGCANWHVLRPRFGYERLHVLLRREGWRVGRNRVHRLYKLEGLQVRMRVRRRKRMSLHRGPALVPERLGSIGRWTSSMTSSPRDGSFAC